MKILREPLLHFLLLGAVIFGAYRFLSNERATQPGNIVVTQGRIEALVAAYTRTWQRPPTASEREGLIGDYIREEVYVREAIALGLDQDDMVIRRRLRQKLEFVSEDLSPLAEATDGQLHAYLAAHQDAFSVEPRFTFRQVFLDPRRRGDQLSHDAAHLLARLRQASTDPDTVGDASMLDHSFGALPASLVAAQFGDQFAAALGKLPIGQWHGPVASAYGAHLVLVDDRTEGRVPDLEEVRDVVRRDWANAQRTEVSEKYYQTLLRRYAVTVEPTQPVMATENPRRTGTVP
ncbi:MAG TPA: peptidylprolyl isomerase [Gemmatimonadales bacterium]|nr:peptidylprolyl isomerase [Gemmatimonadales bacterium]